MKSPRKLLAVVWMILLASAGVNAGAQASGEDTQAPAMAMGAGRMVRGTITAVSPDKLTVKTEQGDLYTVALTPNTQLRKGRDPVKISDVHLGDGVGAMGEVDQPAKTVHALFVAVVSAEDLKKARDAMGKTFIAGTVTAIEDLRLTIKRSDDVVQVIQVDEDTSFRRGGRGMQMVLGGDGGLAGFGSGRRAAGQGANPQTPPPADPGEALTLADVKIGSLVAGPGAIKNGIFVPTTLGITDPGAQRQRRRQAGAGGAGSAPSATQTPATPPTEQN